MMEKYARYALALKALSDPNRLVILEYLLDGEKCACRILEQLRITQPTLSHHMRILCETGLVHCRKTGKWIHYSINHNSFDEMKNYLEHFCGRGDERKKGCCT